MKVYIGSLNLVDVGTINLLRRQLHRHIHYCLSRTLPLRPPCPSQHFGSRCQVQERGQAFLTLQHRKLKALDTTVTLAYIDSSDAQTSFGSADPPVVHVS